MEKFCAGLNMPPPYAIQTYHDLNEKLQKAAEEAAEESTADVAREIKTAMPSQSPDPRIP